MKPQSQIICEYVQKEYEQKEVFSSRDLEASGASKGAITGYLFRMLHRGALERAGKGLYKVVDPALFNHGNHATSGGKRGRKMSPHTKIAGERAKKKPNLHLHVADVLPYLHGPSKESMAEETFRILREDIPNEKSSLSEEQKKHRGKRTLKFFLSIATDKQLMKELKRRYDR